MLYTFRVMEHNDPQTNISPQARLGVQLGIVSQLYTGLLTRLLDPHGVTYPQFALLVHLSRRSGPARVSDMATAVELTQPAVTKMVQKFADAGWVTVQRDSADQRNRPVTMTAEGRTRVQAIQRDFGPTFDAMLQGWTTDEIARLTADLGRLTQFLDQARRTDATQPPAG